VKVVVVITYVSNPGHCGAVMFLENWIQYIAKGPWYKVLEKAYVHIMSGKKRSTRTEATTIRTGINTPARCLKLGNHRKRLRRATDEQPNVCM